MDSTIDDILGANNSFTDKKQFLQQTISNNFTEKVVANSKTTVKSTQETTSQSLININCDPGDNCDKCLLLKLSPEDLTKTDKASIEKRNQIRDTLCAQACTCTAKDITLNNHLSASLLTQINMADIDVKTMAQEITNAMEKQFGDVGGSGQFTSSVEKLLTYIQANFKQEVNQIIVNLQLLSVDGVGFNIKNIDMNLYVDITMQAIQSLSGSIDNENSIQNIVTQEMTWIRKQVDDEVTSGFKKAWGEVKDYVIGMVITIVLIVIAIVGMLMYKAINPPIR